MIHRFAALPFLLALLPAQTPAAGSSAAAIDDEQLELRITDRCEQLRQQGELVALATLQQQAHDNKQCELPAVPPRAAPKSGPELYELVRQSALIVGHYYRCSECEDWHFTGASGFAVSADGAVATCAHLLQDDPDMPTAFLVVADYDGRVWPVQQVAASDAETDVCILRTARTGQVPLPLRADARTGEPIWLLSNPDHQFAFFSQGIVARWYRWREVDASAPAGHRRGATTARQAPAPLWLHITAAFGKGSSGGAVIDACGNGIGLAQSTVTMVYDDSVDKPDVQMVLNTAAPASALQALMRPPAK